MAPPTTMKGRESAACGTSGAAIGRSPCCLRHVGSRVCGSAPHYTYAIVRAMAPLVVRLATVDDAAAICRIYNQGIEDRVATLETELRTPEERVTWLQGRSPRHPVIVAETEAGDLAGWGSLNAYNPRDAYRFVADFSVYVERAQRGRGVGRVVLTRLIELGREHGFHKLVLSAFPFNTGGMSL